MVRFCSHANLNSWHVFTPAYSRARLWVVLAATSTPPSTPTEPRQFNSPYARTPVHPYTLVPGCFNNTVASRRHTIDTVSVFSRQRNAIQHPCLAMRENNPLYLPIRNHDFSPDPRFSSYISVQQVSRLCLRALKICIQLLKEPRSTCLVFTIIDPPHRCLCRCFDARDSRESLSIANGFQGRKIHRPR